MQLFFDSQINAQSDSFTFDKEESKHIVKVLRKSQGDRLFVTNGKGELFETQISLASEKKCVAQIVAITTEQPSQFHIHLAVAPTKMNERFEWFLEKATEMGIAEITPIICEHSERKIVKTERFHKIIQSAMKQSLQFQLAVLNEPQSFKDFVKQEHVGNKYIAHCEDSEKVLLKNHIPLRERYTLLIGPEGDFSKAEIDLALSRDFKAVSLGHTRLRTETAAVVACHSFVFANE